MKKRRLKKGIIYGLYAFAFITVLGTIYMLEIASFKANLEDKPIYVDDTIIDDKTPVVNMSSKIARPYTADSINVAKYYYDAKATVDNQINSLIYYEGTYIPNSGVDYKSNEEFDVVSVLDGIVTNIKEDNLLGKIIEITHEGNLISVYQSLSETSVEIDNQVLQGQIIGKSGNSNLDPSLGNHLHFELIHKGCNVDPEKYYDKKVKEL